jgi:hypothetical protein
MPHLSLKIKRFVIVVSIIFTMPIWASHEVMLLRQLEEAGRAAEAMGDLDGAFACYAQEMAINPAF